MRAVLAGLGTALPPRVVSNDELAARLDTSDEWIRGRTGIAQRHWIEPGMSTSGLAVEAGARALKSAQLEQVGAVLLATTTPDRPCPASAPEVASRLGLGKVAAMDVSAVCAGFVYALATGAGLIGAGIVRDVLVIGADTYSTILDPGDRSTSVIFGDGAGAVVLQAGSADELGALGPFDLGSDGELADLIMMPPGGWFTMQGKPVFWHAVERMAGSARAALDAAGWAAGDVDKFVGHQANRRILVALADRLGVPADRIVCNIDRVGNTAAASIPLALADGGLVAGDRVLLTSFGGGLAWGSTVLKWPAIQPV